MRCLEAVTIWDTTTTFLPMFIGVSVSGLAASMRLTRVRYSLDDIIDKAPYTQKMAVYFDRAADQKDVDRYDDPKKNHVLNLKEEPLITRKFTSKHYWFPFLRKDVKMYPEFSQNPGWE